MTDIRAGDDYDLDEDRLPWLEAVEEEDGRSGPSPLKILVSIVVGLIILGLVVSGVYWMQNRSSAPAEPELIRAEPGDYKIKPADPGGMQVDGEGDTALAASEGAEPVGKLNMDAVPEAPVERPSTPAPVAKAPPPPAAKAQPEAAPKAAPAAETAEAKAPPVGGGQSIQLGAFSSSAGATSAWKSLSSRFKYLEPLAHNVIPVTINGRTLYRLRANGPEARSLCGRLRVAGESCVSVD